MSIVVHNSRWVNRPSPANLIMDQDCAGRHRVLRFPLYFNNVDLFGKHCLRPNRNLPWIGDQSDLSLFVAHHQSINHYSYE